MNFCCTLWKGVAEQIKQSYLSQLQEAENKGVPAFTLIPQRDAIESWGDHCPKCGTNIVTGKTPQIALAPSAMVLPKPVVRKVCHVCKGKKIIAGEGTQDPIRCIKCWGEGYLDERHVLDDSGGGLTQIDVPKGLEKD